MRAKILEVTSQAATVSSSSHDISLCEAFSVQIITANQSSANYSAQVEVSNDDSNWDAVSGATATITADGSDTIAVSSAPYKYARVTLTRTAGTADFTIRIFGTEVAEC